MVAILPSLIAYAALAAAGPAARRAVDKLDAAATEEAQQRDGTATRAFSDVQIKVSLRRLLPQMLGLANTKSRLPMAGVSLLMSSLGTFART